VAGDLGHERGGVAADGAGDADQLHDVEAPLPGLDLRHPRGVAAEPRREGALGEPRRLPGLDEEGDEPPVGGRVDGLLGGD